MKKIAHTLLFYLLTLSTLQAATLSSKIHDNSLIVYNGDIALVHEERDFSVQTGDTQIVYEDVASTIDTDSVNVKLSDSLLLYSQQYRFDKLTHNKLLDASINKKVKVKMLQTPQSYETITAHLLSNDGSFSLVKTAQNEIITVESKNLIFEAIPSELITKPSLVWNIKTDKNIKTSMEIDYLIKHVSWQSNYILELHKESANLSGWITIDNRSGKKFTDTDLYVLAGEINRAQKPQTFYKEARVMMVSDAMPNEIAHEGYHFYTVPFKVTLADNEKTQIKFINKNNISINRTYSAMLSNPTFVESETEHDVTQYINFKTTDFILPRGVIRTYSQIKETNILLGESNIGHTPKETPLTLKLGQNFDLKVTQTLLKRDDNNNYYEADILYSIHNSSNEAKTVDLLIPFAKDSKNTIESTKSYIFTKGNLATFTLKMQAESRESFKVNFKIKR